MKRLLCALVLCLSACGGGSSAPVFVGNYGGSLSLAGTCSDGSGGSERVTVLWNLSQNSDTVSISTGGTCGVVLASANGTSASLQPKQCQPTTDANGNPLQGQLTGGGVTMNSTTLVVDAYNFRTTNNVGGVCNLVGTGNLAKQ